MRAARVAGQAGRPGSAATVAPPTLAASAPLAPAAPAVVAGPALPGIVAPGAARAVSKAEPAFDPTSWSGALLTMGVFGALLWVVQFVNSAMNYRLDRYGLRPRVGEGLRGVLFSPFLHSSYGQLIANSAPFVLIGWAVLLAGVRTLVVSSALILVVGGLAAWLVAPGGVVVGASGLIMGWLGYLLARAVFSRRVLWIIVAAMVLFFFGGLFGGLLNSVNSAVSWQSQVTGFAAGIFAAWLLHPRTPRRTRGGGPARAGGLS